ncbi:hypothetical protein ILUMI_18453, partial [Ignelater luminosus]
MKLILLSSVGVAILSTYWLSSSRNNVCKTFKDYYWFKNSNPNCYYNPEADLTVVSITSDEIIKRRGYPVEIHNATTEDGYIITIFRIPHGKKKSSTLKEQPRQPVFLLHGVGLNSESYINIGKKSL